MTTSGQICKISYTTYCNAYCNMGQSYCNLLQYAFCRIVSPLQTKIFLYNVVLNGCRKVNRKKKKTEEEKEDETRARDIVML